VSCIEEKLMTQPSDSAGTPRVRASDADREAAVGTLHEAVGRGLLTLEEAQERIGAAYAARFLDELPVLTADLPAAPVPAPVAPGWRALLVLAWLQLRTALAAFSWRGTGRTVRARPRLAVAAVALLALLAFGAASGGEGFDHGGHFDHGHHLQRN
jgi:hypothetical protein